MCSHKGKFSLFLFYHNCKNFAVHGTINLESDFMLNEEKIRLMTDLAMFEKENKSSLKNASGYFKSDYISRSLISGLISYSLCFMMLMAVWVLLNMDAFLSTMEFEALAELAWKGGGIYLAGLFVYLAVITLVYGRRYDYETRMNRIYLSKLKHLDKRYEYQSRSRDLAREGNRL